MKEEQAAQTESKSVEEQLAELQTALKCCIGAISEVGLMHLHDRHGDESLAKDSFELSKQYIRQACKTLGVEVGEA